MLVDSKKLIFELPETGGHRHYLNHEEALCGKLSTWYGKDNLRSELPFPNLGEVQVVRHYTNLSEKNYGVENGPYPLGSCTMKYNPKVNEDVAALPGFVNLHPLQPESTVQGVLAALKFHEQQLCDLSGFDRFTFQPSAGAHGELTAVMLIHAYHRDHGHPERKFMLIPDSAHGTNPASAAMAGFTVREVKSLPNGEVDVDDLRAKIGDGHDIAGMMMTNPNTLGVFETKISQITKMVHDAGGLMFYDGANLNAVMMHVRPGDMGFDCCHLNVHKTLSTPHGGGGPGAGPVGCKEILAPYLPKPILAEKNGKYFWDDKRPKSIGRVRSFNGAIAVLLRSAAYAMANGVDGLYEASEAAVANANYVYASIKDDFDRLQDDPIMHEFVISGSRQAKLGCNTMDMAKRLIDYGCHPPTVYFPLTVPEAMMVEPTDTETREGLDQLIAGLKRVAAEVQNDPQTVKEAPHGTPVRRPDEVRAAKQIDVRF